LQAQAYVGPGLGAGVIGVLFGLLASVVLALLAIVWYPLKRLLRRFSRRSESAGLPEDAGHADDAKPPGVQGPETIDR
jgi:hypothetical protein